MRRIHLFSSTAVNAFGVLGLQVLALIFLTPEQFGAFSIQYLLMAWGMSLTFSLISEAWLRNGATSNWASYSSVLVYFSAFSGIVVLGISLIIPVLHSIAILSSIAVAFTLYRTGARFHSLKEKRLTPVFIGDSLCLAVVASGWVYALVVGERGLDFVALVWAASSVAAALGSGLPRLRGPRVLSRWVSTHRTQIGPLIRDSLLVDLSAIGTPYLLLGFLSVSQFGIYRAVSNVAAPVRLIINPLKPVLGSMSLRRQGSMKMILLVIMGAVGFGVMAYICLVILQILPVNVGTLSALTPYALPTAISIVGNFLTHYYTTVARVKLPSRQLLLGRIAFLTLTTVPLLIAVSIWGLAGAIWAYGLGFALAGLIWLALVVRQAKSSQSIA
ncbi:hypothetical protein [Lysinibacter cavernae]|uniref:Lipopolysaccharide biosynthesis protein n=1 Tax=Lysinibacter cavernae TaxID=1640652 RepID=A0A7X5TTE8_9MICO|nr:hypothetical protein [Lysinibacter cavernae]NIH54115.1 hypothetical protein [Lysinibacter cavernae]